MNHSGAFLISLDFEMLWGVIDQYTPSDYGLSNVKNVGIVFREMLALFEKYGVKATVGYVGMIFYPDKEHLLKDLPSVVPTYKKQILSPYEYGYIESIREDDQVLYFAPNLVQMLSQNCNIELGTHTFCHYYCNEEGQNVEEFESDLKKAIEQAGKNGIELRSIIFPRNQVREEYLKICSKYGIECYRGNALRFFGAKTFWKKLKNKMCRLLDSYIDVGGPSSFPFSDINLEEKPVNIRASRFFRPYDSKLSLLEPLRLRRIKKELEYAARNNEVYHLWWHPHNFGKDIEHNLSNLERVLGCFSKCQEKYGIQSYTMSGLLDYISAGKQNG